MSLLAIFIHGGEAKTHVCYYENSDNKSCYLVVIARFTLLDLLLAVNRGNLMFLLAIFIRGGEALLMGVR
jgi:hypothetical protein